MNAIQDLLIPLAKGEDMTHEDAQHAFQIIMNGGATPAQMGAFLMGLREKGETVDEITAGAEVLRIKAPKIKAPLGTIDVCGTGGDTKGTLNISTAVAFVLAGCGVPVAKHGNRGVSSASGSADVLAELGVKLDADIPTLERALVECNICFIMAPYFHKAMKHIAPVRQELGLRTIFNLLGPLCNPASPQFQLLGVYDEKWLEPMAHTLHKLGVRRAWVVHGDGLDELTTTGETHVVEMHNGIVHSFTVTPEQAGLPRAMLADLKGGDPEHNARMLRDVLGGAQGAYLDIVLLNSAAGLVIAGKAKDLRSGVAMAMKAIENGKALNALRDLVNITHGG